MKIRLIFLLSIAILFIIIVTLFFFNQGGVKNTPSTNKNILSPTQIAGGDRDEHGCIGSAGYSWCEIKRKCVRPWEEPCDNE